ncbi:hypothetical protein D9613_002206 [Agrocybe pediades]|uniref:Uncharacterized protein n=1 Tax=Agrocybe pediades TaxID=84607 RepID=A0A8H4R8A0_9AGAR|nr:hypothetical protein D9613_002206 [Agrocybe pediades]
MNTHVPSTPVATPANAPVYLKHDPMLPIAAKPGWEKEEMDVDQESEPLKSVADSFVLFKSLRQSRERLLLHTFPKFSSGKGRGTKLTDSAAQHKPQSVQSRGKCDITIGPHTFPETNICEVHYLAPAAPQTIASPGAPYWQPASAASTSTPSAPVTAAASSASILKTATSSITPAAEMVPAPLISELTSSSPVPQDLIRQVNFAASTDPIFSNLLQLAASKTATQGQVATLGVFIQSLASMSAALASSSTTPAAKPATPASNEGPSNSVPNYFKITPQVQLPVKEFDLILEFREAPSERWLIPRGCHPTITRSGQDLILKVAISNTGQTPAISPNPNDDPKDQVPLSFCLCDPPYAIWDSVTRWIGGEDRMKENQQFLDSLVVPERLYPSLQLRPGPLLTQLQTSCTAPYTMRPLRQGPAQVRPPRQRSGAAQKRAADNKPSEVPRSKTKKTVVPTPIQCLSCGQPDVPLILGGRFCRPCVESGKATPLPPVPSVNPPPNPAAQSPAVLPNA